MKKLKNEQGIALVFTLLIVVILVTIGGAFVLRAITEWNMANREKKGSQAFHIAEGGGHAGMLKLDELINTNLLNTVNGTNPQVLGNKAEDYVADGDGLGFLVLYTKNGGTTLLTLNGQQATYTQNSTNLGSGSYSYNINITEKSNPVTIATDIWDFPYYYEVQVTGNVGGVLRKVRLLGDFTVRVQRDNFAKYALFTDHHGMPSGSTVWFTDKTKFKGPIHTNEQFSYALNPSGTFDGAVTQQNTKSKFYNLGSPVQLNADSNPPRDVPTFNSTNTRGVNEIVLASSVQKQDLYDQARGGDVTVGSGIFVANNGASLTGGIYVKGDSTVSLSVVNDNATYTIAQGGTTKVVTVDIPNNQTTVQTVGGGSSTYAGQPDGIDNLGTILYVDGSVTSLSGTVQKDTEVTISTENDIVISNHLKYSKYKESGNPGDPDYVPPSVPTDVNDPDYGKNLLGLVAWGGNVRVGSSAPNDVDMHAIVMARNGVFQVDNYDSQVVGPRGTATLLGGAITQFYGAFGQFNGQTGQQVSGYGRNFVYDSRTLLGKSPPYFPSMRAFIAFTNDIMDKKVFQQGGF